MSSPEEWYYSQNYFNQDELETFCPNLNLMSCFNNPEPQLLFDPNVYPITSNYSDILPLEFEMQGIANNQMDVADFPVNSTTPTEAQQQLNEEGDSRQDEHQSIIETLNNQEGRIERLEIDFPKQDAIQKIQHEIAEISRQFTEMQLNIEEYFRNAMQWTTDCSQTVEELASKVESTSEKIEDLQAEIGKTRGR